MDTVATSSTYHVRTEVSSEVQKELSKEQGRRQLEGERVSLMAIAAEWLEEIAQQKSSARL